jgi:hypothetical protein
VVVGFDDDGPEVSVELVLPDEGVLGATVEGADVSVVDGRLGGWVVVVASVVVVVDAVVVVVGRVVLVVGRVDGTPPQNGIPKMIGQVVEV